MKYLTQLAIIFAVLTGGSNIAQAEEWRVSSGKNPAGQNYVAMRTKMHEFALEFQCDEHDWQDNRLGVKFIGPALPRLYGEDDETAKLSLLFTMRGGVLYRESWDAYYFDGGLGDQAWLGSINAGKSELDALARATKLEILNPDSEVVYRFGTKGTSAGVAKIREVCKLGLE
ncbi:hypothetical protein [Maritalea sp.]|uniref:hypothetical protein n=1 Tax=Maritalea sp. TaxID=2003361 RepID=UPI003EF53335